MPKLACSIPIDVVLACSGGADSLSALNFLLKGRRNVTVAHYNHGTAHANDAEEFVTGVCKDLNVPFEVERAKPGVLKNELEWREARYGFLKNFKLPVITAHHLDDAIEWWIFSSLRANPSLIPIKRKLGDTEVIRPFLFFRKEQLVSKFGFEDFVKDPTNLNLAHARNRIRHNIVPEAVKINPGLFTTILNLYKRTS